jgi:hypothetical protein
MFAAHTNPCANERTRVESEPLKSCRAEVSVSFIEGSARQEVSLLPPCVDDYVVSDALVRVVDAFVGA